MSCAAAGALEIVLMIISTNVFVVIFAQAASPPASAEWLFAEGEYSRRFGAGE